MTLSLNREGCMAFFALYEYIIHSQPFHNFPHMLSIHVASSFVVDYSL
jgi:hypothetical protein